MKSQDLGNRLLVLMLMVCCSQYISAGKSKNSTNTNKDIQKPITKQPKITYKAKTTTPKSTELEITTLLPPDMDLDGRSAFINNQFVFSPEEPTAQDTSSTLYGIMEQQMSNAAAKTDSYTNNSPQLQEDIDDADSEELKVPKKPLFSAYGLEQFGDYDAEEDTSEYGGTKDGEYVNIPDNCEDTQESLGDNDDVANNNKDNISPLIENNQQNSQNNYGQSSVMFNQLAQNKPYDSTNHGPQTLQATSSLYELDENSNGSKILQQHSNKNSNKSNPKLANQKNDNQNGYSPAEPFENYSQNKQNSLTKQTTNKQASSANSEYLSVNQQQGSLNNQKSHIKLVTQHSKPKPSYIRLNSKTQSQYNPNSNAANYGSIQVTNPSTATSTAVEPALTANYAYGHSNTEPLLSSSSSLPSPFSSTSSRRRHLTFRTVASSTQYVSSPLADLMLKFSIGMAKPKSSRVNSVNNAGRNRAHIYNVFNDMATKPHTQC